MSSYLRQSLLWTTTPECAFLYSRFVHPFSITLLHLMPYLDQSLVFVNNARPNKLPPRLTAEHCIVWLGYWLSFLPIVPETVPKGSMSDRIDITQELCLAWYGANSLFCFFKLYNSLFYSSLLWIGQNRNAQKKFFNFKFTIM